MPKRGRITFLIAVGLMAGGTTAFAGTVGPTCNNCYGGIFGVTGYENPVAPAGYDSWTIFYDIDLTGFNGPADYYISEVAVKLVGGPNSYQSVVLNTGLSSSNIGSWNSPVVINSNLGGGCGGNGNGWFCIGGGHLTGGSTYRLAFDVVFKEGTMISDASIQANWDPPTGVLLSEKVGVPEGSGGELPLLLAGIGGLLIWRKRAPLQHQ